MDNIDLASYFTELGYKPGERPNLSDLKKRWKELSRKAHPDVPGGSEEAFNKLTHAYKMLSDPEYRQRATVDEMKRGKPNLKGDLNIRIQVPVPFEDAFFGRRMVVSFNRPEFDVNFKVVPKDIQDVVSIAVDIPPGSMQGFEASMLGMGCACNGMTGNALLVFTPLSHPRFRVQGTDVVADELVPLEILLKGGIIDVQTMYGTKALRVPPGTVPGTPLPIKRHGVQKIGSHCAVIRPVFPTKEDLKKDGWKGLDVNWAMAEPEEDEPAYTGIGQFIWRSV